MTDQELDLRPLPAPDKRPTLLAAYAALRVGDCVVVVDDVDPPHLRAEFEAEHVGDHDWSVLGFDPHEWRVQITRLAATALPRVLTNTAALTSTASPDASGAIWNLPVRQRDLDSNVIALPPGGSIQAHAGPDLDVLIHVIDGSGQLITELGRVELCPGDVGWLPRGSRREFVAGADGIHYLTVHRRREALVLGPTPPPLSSGADGGQ